MAEHKPGSMDIREHEKTFNGFVHVVTWAVVVVLGVLILLALART